MRQKNDYIDTVATINRLQRVNLYTQVTALMPVDHDPDRYGSTHIEAVRQNDKYGSTEAKANMKPTSRNINTPHVKL